MGNNKNRAFPKRFFPCYPKRFLVLSFYVTHHQEIFSDGQYSATKEGVPMSSSMCTVGPRSELTISGPKAVVISPKERPKLTIVPGPQVHIASELPYICILLCRIILST